MKNYFRNQKLRVLQHQLAREYPIYITVSVLRIKKLRKTFFGVTPIFLPVIISIIAKELSFATNSYFQISISLQPNVVDL